MKKPLKITFAILAACALLGVGFIAGAATIYLLTQTEREHIDDISSNTYQRENKFDFGTSPNTNRGNTNRDRDDDEDYLRVEALKPVIYLYPTKPTDVLVQLEYDGEIVADDPDYNEEISGWQVQAEPNGQLTTAAGKIYPYLFWEGKPTDPGRYKNPIAGFVVTAKAAEEFLRTTLPQLGLVENESEEFIEFWLPRLQQNPYNLVHFAGAEYLDEATLTVTPVPDSVIRVFMVVQPLTQPIHIPQQKIVTPFRQGFTVVEWGGTILPTLNPQPSNP